MKHLLILNQNKEFSNTINKKDIITGIDRPIKFKEKHELVAKIIQFIKENVFKYQ